jgi:transposase
MKELIRVVQCLPPPFEPNDRGRPCKDPRLVAFAVIWKILFCHSYDSIESALKMHEEILLQQFNVDSLPTHSVIHRGMHRMSMKYIRKVISFLIVKFRRKGMTVAVDSTGFSLSNSSKWFDIRIQRISSRRESMKLHIVIDIETGIIHHFSTTTWNRHDSMEFKKMITALPQISAALGDKAYSSRMNCQLVADRGGIPYLIFKDNVKGTAKGNSAWKISFHKYKKNNEEWMKTYHLRSIVESVFSSLKKRWNGHISSKKPWHRRRELALKVLAYNLKQVLYNSRAQEIGTSLWTQIIQTNP